MKLIFAVTGSFCNHARALSVLEELVRAGNTVLPVISETAAKTNTRFGTGISLCDKVTGLCGAEPVLTIAGAEEAVTSFGADCLVVCPCTGNTLARIACGITDSAVTMAVKSQLRNRRPVLIALASNDSLGANFKNMGICFDKKHVFLSPLKQDDPAGKPTSLVCDFTRVSDAVRLAADGKQYQPLFV